MLSERQLQRLLKVFEARFQNLVDEYITRMGEHLRDIGKLTETDVHRLKQLKRMNANVEAIKKKIARAAAASVEDVEKVFRHIAESNLDFANTMYGETHSPGVKVSPIKTLSSPMERILKAQLRITAQTMVNLSQTTIVSDGYKAAVDVAVQAVQSGLTDYNSAIRRALKEASRDGLMIESPKGPRAEYFSGHRRRLDTAVRQNVLDGMRALNQDTLDQLGKEFGADGVEISAHMLCATDHMPYQGLQFSNEEFNEIQGKLDRPFGMWNCKHTMYPILLGISPPSHTKEELEMYRNYSQEAVTIDGVTMSRYEWSQQQRRIETAVREQKYIAVGAKAAGDPVARRGAQAAINRLQTMYAKISDAAGLTPEKERMVVAGFRKVSTLTPKESRAMLRTTDDPMREVMGSAFLSHASEVSKIIKALEKDGVEIDYRTNAMGYSPGLRRGNPGRFIIDPEASYSAWLHEKTHADDDKASGWNGMQLLINPETHAQMESHAYDVEIDFALSLGYNEVAKKLKELKEKSLREVYGENED